MDYGLVNVKGDLRPTTLAGTIRYVGANCQYTTIDSAINASSAGDTILVAPGTYTEAITYDVDNLSIIGIGGKENTTITQAAATVVDFSTMEGCLLGGFTVSLTAADGATDYTITGANDTSNSTKNIIRSCDITSATAIAVDLANVYLTDGDWEFWYCKIQTTRTTDTGAYYVRSIEITAVDNLKLYHCDIISDNSTTGTGNGASYGIIANSADANTTEIRDSFIDVSSDATTTGGSFGIYVNGAIHNFKIYNTHFDVDCSSTGLAIGIYILGNISVIWTYNNIFDVNNSDADQNWVKVGAGCALNSYGDHIIDGSLSNAGTANIYGTLPAGDAGYMAVSSATTGGAGSAGAGNQYIELRINGTTYKALYDT